MKIIAFAAATGLLAAGAALAQGNFPDRPVQMIVPFPPGGVVDITGRPFAAALEKVIKQPVVIVNKAGAAGAVGNAAAANASADGYTLLASLTSILIIPEADKLFNRKPAYTLDQLQPIALLSADPTYLAVQAQSPWKSVKELVEAAKAKPNSLSYSSSGVYGALHVPIEMFAHAAGIRMRHVPTSGGGPAVTALLGGHVDMTCGGPAALDAQAKAGKLRILAGWGAKRHPGLPDVPTFKELGYNIEYYIWVGLFAPAKVPQPIATKWRELVRQAATSAEFKEQMAKVNTPIYYLDAPEFRKFIDADQKRLAEVVKVIGKVDDKK
jgi:tripartite-type tricarboxylate transporter receptor subunit TctC